MTDQTVPAGKWSVTRYEDGLWRVWDGYEDYIGTYPTWEEAMRYAHRYARTIITDNKETHHESR